MKIVIAAWHLKNFNVGIGRYIRNLIEGIGRVDQENQYEILVPDHSTRVSPWPNIRYRYVGFPSFKLRYWEQIAPLCVGPYDLLHFPYDSCIAIKRGKFVATIHDVIPLLLPDGRIPWPWKGLFKRILIPKPFKQIDHVVTVSECSKRDIMERLGVPEHRISVVYQGVEFDRFFPSRAPHSDRKTNSPYILCVAGDSPNKNVGTLLQAYFSLPNSIRGQYRLVLAGDVQKSEHLPSLIQKLGLEKHIEFTGIISDERLARLYQDAAVFVFPTLYEGFGLPVLEAMACACPVITSNTSSLPEVVGDAGILIHPLDASAISAAIKRVLSDPGLSERLRNAAVQRAKQFSWDRTARETVELYRKVVGTGRSE
jgi:glycosyltransferase involved in cell wall biosynthesis